MGTEIYVYQDIKYYKKVYDNNTDSVISHVDIDRLFIKQPENRLWVSLKMEKEHNRPDMDRSIVLFFAGVSEKDVNPLVYKQGEEPIEIFPTDVYYNGDTNKLEFITNRGIIRKKRVEFQVDRYHGDNRPNGRAVVGYGWFYDRSRNRINLVLLPNQLR